MLRISWTFQIEWICGRCCVSKKWYSKMWLEEICLLQLWNICHAGCTTEAGLRLEKTCWRHNVSDNSSWFAVDQRHFWMHFGKLRKIKFPKYRWLAEVLRRSEALFIKKRFVLDTKKNWASSLETIAIFCLAGFWAPKKAQNQERCFIHHIKLALLEPCNEKDQDHESRQQRVHFDSSEIL